MQSQGQGSDDDTEARAHQADAIEVGLLAGALLGALPRLIALVQQLDLLQLLERLGEQRLGVFELDAQLVGRARQVLATLDRGSSLFVAYLLAGQSSPTRRGKHY